MVRLMHACMISAEDDGTASRTHFCTAMVSTDR